MKKKQTKHLFIVSLEINSDEWYYKKGQVIKTVVYTGNYGHAIDMAHSFGGSEVPSYKVLSVEKVDEFIFSPIGTNPLYEQNSHR